MPRVALVTGGARGIGLAIAERLVCDGFAVSVMDVGEEPSDALEQLRDKAEARDLVRYLRGSVADLADHGRFLEDALSAWGRLDVLVNNAGVGPTTRADLLEATPESFDRVLDINLRGPYFLTQAFANRVIALRTGEQEATDTTPGPVPTIVNISSISATVASTNRGEYCISKAGVAMATRLWSVRLGGHGILVYEVRPGIIATDMTAGVKDKYDALLAGGLAPIARWGRPEDVADAVGILASGRTPYSTGEVFHVDGGMHIPTF